MRGYWGVPVALHPLWEGRVGYSATVGCLSRSSCVVTTFGPLTRKARTNSPAASAIGRES
ncbi:MAG TPA: hypothetical protein PLI34_07405 [Saprospiraceae bacterium]|nr:hypothetical protein [Saprospiraceae bacterium]